MLAAVLLGAGCAPAAEFYVAPDGDDANPGTEARPFATPHRALEAVRGERTGGPVDVVLREGVYHLPRPLALEPRDSGAERAPVVWRAAEGERVVLSGGRPIRGRWHTEDGKTWYVDVPEARDGRWIFRQLFVDGARMTRARFPNRTASNPFLYAEGGGRSFVRVDRALLKRSWGEAVDAQINMVPGWKFFNQWNTVTRVDLETGEIHLADSELHAEIVEGNWFWIEGVREELDEPGEWFLDHQAGRLYYMPGPGLDPNAQTVVAPFLNRIVHARGDVERKTHVEHVHFRDLEFRHTTFTLGHIEARVHTDAAVLLENARRCRVDRCRFEHIGGYALWLHLDSRGNVFDRNTVSESGGGGVLLTGARFSYMDDGKLFTPGEVAATVFPVRNRITRNTVAGGGRIRYYGGGVHLDSRPAVMAMEPGNYIAHNHFRDLSRNGIFAFRNQGGNVVEYNHIHDVMQTTIDGAGIHFATMTRLNAPNFILNNYLYDIWGYEQQPDGKPKRHLANGVFLDWATSNTTVRDNYIYNAGGEPIKHIMGNRNLRIAGNEASDTRIVPPFVDEVGPGGTATHGIDLEQNRLTGRVVHYTDEELVAYSGGWERRTITGFWNLFSFHMLEADTAGAAEISYALPVEEDGTYQVSLLYMPDDRNASNARIRVEHADGVSERTWNMKQGDRFGFALEIGAYRFRNGGAARVRISNEGADGLVVADAVAFVRVAGE